MKSRIFAFLLLFTSGIWMVSATGDPVREPQPALLNAQAPPELSALPAVGERNRDPLDQGADACPATVIGGLPYGDDGTTVGRANNWNTAASCAGGGGGSFAPDVIYSLTPPSSNTFLISTCSSAFNTLLEIRSGGLCPGTTQIACADAGCGGSAELIVNLSAGVTYYIILDGWGTQSGAYALNVEAMCNVYAQAGDLIECAETPDSSHARLDCNGGPCNESYGGPALYTYLTHGQTFFGHGFTYSRLGVPLSDTDWFRFRVYDSCAVRVSTTAEFPHIISLGPIITECDYHANSAGARTCFSGFLAASVFAPGEHEFTISPWDATGISTPRDYRVLLEYFPFSDCVVDGELTAPGTRSGNTCSSLSDCDWRDGPEHMIRVTIPDEDDWTFALCNSAVDWGQTLFVTDSCCGYDHYIMSARQGCGYLHGALPQLSCQHLTAGTYYVTIEGDPGECGDYVLDITRCRQRCCYGPEFVEDCVNTSWTACDALGGIFDAYKSCATDPCPEIQPCMSGATFSQRPCGLDDSYQNAWGSDSATDEIQYQRITVPSNEIKSLRFWGHRINPASYANCQENPMPFTIEVRADSGYQHPGMVLASFATTAQGHPVAYDPDYWGDTLYEFNAVVSLPVSVNPWWLGIIGGGDPTCAFRWFFSRTGEDRSWHLNSDPLDWWLTFANMAVCAAPCAQTDSLVLKYNGGISYTLSFWAPLDAEYRMYVTTQMNTEYPTGFVLSGHPELLAGRRSYTFNSGSVYQRWVVVTNCP